MELSFSKMNGLGNDFVMINDLEKKLDLSEEEIRWICDRHFGIGADGVILIRPSERPECAALMYYINSDGSLAQMCGNGIRCFSKYLLDKGIVAKGTPAFMADTLSGPKKITYTLDDEGMMRDATVDMGEPILDPGMIPVEAAVDSISDEGVPYVGDLRLDSPWGEFDFCCVSMGNPHAITFLDDLYALPEDLFYHYDNRSLSTMKIDEIGKYFEECPAFPEKTNVEFACIKDDCIEMRVYERGCGETLACGTGACATLVAAALKHLSGRKNILDLRGGPLHINWDKNGHVLMTGPAQESFTGVFDLCDADGAMR